MKIGIIGVGAMGSAVGLRLLEQPPFTDFQLVLCDSDADRLQRFEKYSAAILTNKLTDLAGCHFVIVAVKPHGVSAVLNQLQQVDVGIIISIAAGISLAELSEASGKPVVRVMPNTPCQIGAGVSALAFANDFSDENRDLVMKIFSVLGEVVVVEEALFPIVTALSGCGPAYVFLMIEALIDAGCSQGLTRETAHKLVTATFAGSAKMLQQSQSHPAVLKDQVTSPGGITIQALHVLEQKGLRGILWDAVNRAAET